MEFKSRDAAQAALVVLALIASVIMLLTSNASFLRLALIAALWAAVIGFFLVSRYRTQAEKAHAELEQQRQLHAVQLEQARQELSVERAHIEADAERRIKEDTLAEIRVQLNDVREQLAQLTGQLYSEPTMVQAEAKRIFEIEQEKTPEPTYIPEPEPVEPEPTYIPEPEPEPRRFDTGSFGSIDWLQGGITQEEEPKPPVVAEHGRRRRDEHSAGLSVADLLKRRD
ncbi:Dihydroneopterin aldolase [Corynebacterium kutscheri]|uniref:DUF6779 domain-containing protein n=1 Tax=Corynebacterium kutscheri TaxID=35755 RepID=A0A0F6R100_9CORY|nr:DUF6779 domain-containing protein [Corynebacterium kutscheri]AKE40743.1 Protein of unknown function (DUF4229) [Corynebacterium kutscheri]VEH11141.1 Dihydroneopterin aldolase [Corynebacterium kutscheri]VEH80382.1 Dihydroneopterin aldolase [Corynebacterium kutscheri]